MREKPLTEFIGSKKATKEQGEKPAEPKVGVKGPWELPEGWRWVKLGEVVIPNNGIKRGPWGGSIKKEYFVPFGYKVYEQKNVINRDFTLGHYYIDEKKFQELKDFEVKPGDILITAAGTLGKIAIVPNGIEKGIINQALIRIRLKESIILPTFFVYLFEHYSERNVFSEFSRGGVLKNLASTRELKKLPIPLPPLEEQKRIVAKLDELNKRIEEAKRLAREAKEEAEKLMASALHEVFSKAEEKGWAWKKIKKVAGIRGNAGVKKKLSQFDSIAFIPMELIPENGVFARYELREPVNIKSYSYSEPGDILLAKITPSFENGKQGIVPENVPNGFALATTEVYPIYIKDTNSLDRMYLFYILRSKYAREILEDQMLGTTGRQRVPKEAVLKLKIPLPPLEEQKRIVTYLDSISERAQKLVKLYEERERELERLFPAILDRAFRGEL